MPRLRLLAIAASVACALGHFAHRPTFAQTPAPAAPLKFEVIFTDDKGKTVEDVRADEIRLFVNGTERKVAGLVLEETPTTYGLVVDNSGSLRTQIGAVVVTAQSFVASNRPGDETFVVRFVASDQINLLHDFTSDVAALQRAIGEMYVDKGQTAVIDALYTSTEHILKNRPAARSRRVLVLLSDGEDRASYNKADELVKLLRGTNVQLFCVGFVGELDKEQGFITKSKRDKATVLLKRLASETGGLAFFPENIAELKAAFGEVVKHLHARRVITAEPDGGLRPEGIRKVEVKVIEGPNGKKRKAVVRPLNVRREAGPADGKN